MSTTILAAAWSGLAGPDGPDAYLRHYSAEVEPALRATAGFAGAAVLCRPIASGTEVLVVTRWESREARERFAGGDLDRAVVHPDARAALRAVDERVRLYRICGAVWCPAG